MDLSALPSHLLASTLKKVSTPTFISLNKSCKWVRQLLLEVKPQLPKILNYIWIRRTPINWQIIVNEVVNGFSAFNQCTFSEEPFFEPFFDLFCKRYAGFCFGVIDMKNSGSNLPPTVTEKEIKMFKKIVTTLADNNISCYLYVANFSPTEEVFTKLKPMVFSAFGVKEQLWKYTEKCRRLKRIHLSYLIDISDLLLALDGRCDDCECITMEIPKGCEETVFPKLLEFMKMRKRGKRCRRLVAEYCSWSTAVTDVPDFPEFLNQEDFELAPLESNSELDSRGYKLVYKRLIYNGELGTTVARLAYGTNFYKYNVIYFDCLDFDGKETTFPGKPFPWRSLENLSDDP